MYAGHFATALLFHSYFPEVNPFLFTFGVGILDIVFGILAYFHVEGLSINPKAGLLGLDLHCPFTHSLVGSLTISLLWGSLSLDVRSFLPVFASAFSHFIEDWFVHNRDLELYPGSSVFVGGLRLWSRYPYGSYYLELALCTVCSIEMLRQKMTALTFGIQNIRLCLAVCYVLYLHYQRRPAVSRQLSQVLETTPKEKQGLIVFKAFMKSFTFPAVILGFLLYF